MGVRGVGKMVPFFAVVTVVVIRQEYFCAVTTRTAPPCLAIPVGFLEKFGRTSVPGAWKKNWWYEAL